MYIGPCLWYRTYLLSSFSLLNVLRFMQSRFVWLNESESAVDGEGGVALSVGLVIRPWICFVTGQVIVIIIIIITIIVIIIITIIIVIIINTRPQPTLALMEWSGLDTAWRTGIFWDFFKVSLPTSDAELGTNSDFFWIKRPFNSRNGQESSLTEMMPASPFLHLEN